jgi:GNAT superfamily N-acetyltransferase
MEIKQAKTGPKEMSFYYRVPETRNVLQPAQIDISEFQTDTWYINRLIVPKKARGQGIATALMKELVAWADHNNIKLISEINPYGDLDKEQLIAFYQKFKFILTENKDGEFIIRKPVAKRGVS